MNGETNPAANPAASQVRIPAILLMCFAGLEALLLVGDLALSFVMPREFIERQHEMVPSSWRFLESPAISIAFTLCMLIPLALMFFGAWRMLSLRSYGLALTSAIVAMLPCACCCVTLPVGVWAVVLLMKPEVKQAFH